VLQVGQGAGEAGGQGGIEPDVERALGDVEAARQADGLQARVGRVELAGGAGGSGAEYL
jgi:hypothetical protein